MLLKSHIVRPVWGHAAVQGSSAGDESDGKKMSNGKGGPNTQAMRHVPAIDLGFVLPANEAHELAHAVAMVPRRTESVVLDLPPRWEDDKVAHSHARDSSRGSEDAVDGRIRVVEADGVHGAEVVEVVLVRRIVTVPSDNVEGRMVLLRGKELSKELVHNSEVGLPVLVVSDRILEVTGIGKTIRADWAKVREMKEGIKNLG